MNREELLAKHGELRKIGTDGHVRLVDVMGDDAAIVQAARVSYGKGTKTINEDRGLIRYLMRHRHTTPMEMCEIKLHIKMPMDSHRQQIRHRTFSVNEYSTRYSEAMDCREVTPVEGWRLQSRNNKQGSAGFMIDADEAHLEGNMLSGVEVADRLSARELELHELSNAVYQERLAAGVAREQARKDLPLSTYTEYYWKGNLHNLFHYLSLRMHSHAQKEIREFAEAIYDIVQDWVPIAVEAFKDYRLEASGFSGPELRILKTLLSTNHGELIQHVDYDYPEGDDEFEQFYAEVAFTTGLKTGLAKEGWYLFSAKDGKAELRRPRTVHDLTQDERIGFMEDEGVSNARERREFWVKLGVV